MKECKTWSLLSSWFDRLFEECFTVFIFSDDGVFGEITIEGWDGRVFVFLIQDNFNLFLFVLPIGNHSLNSFLHWFHQGWFHSGENEEVFDFLEHGFKVSGNCFHLVGEEDYSLSIRSFDCDDFFIRMFKINSISIQNYWVNNKNEYLFKIIFFTRTIVSENSQLETEQQMVLNTMQRPLMDTFAERK